MPTSFLIHPTRRLIYARLFGQATVEEVLASRAEAARHPDFDPTFDVLYDVRDADLSRFPPSWVDRLSTASIFHPSSRRTIVAGSDDKFGLARMFEIRWELSGNEPVQMMVVRTLPESLAWLGLSDFDPTVPST
jgi:hypothetical protein